MHAYTHTHTHTHTHTYIPSPPASFVPQAEFDFRKASTLLVAHVYLSNFYAWDVDVSDTGGGAGTGRAAADEGLLLPQSEVLAIFQRTRARLLFWLAANPRLADEAM
jgi:hypothetical protein